MSDLLSHNNNQCPVLAEWSALIKRSPEEQALARVSVDIDVLQQSLLNWIELYRRKVQSGEVPANGLMLPVDHTKIAQCIAYFSCLTEA